MNLIVELNKAEHGYRDRNGGDDFSLVKELALIADKLLPKGKTAYPDVGKSGT